MLILPNAGHQYKLATTKKGHRKPTILIVRFIFMPPTLKKLMGHIAFGAWVRAWVTLFVPTVTFKPLKLES